MGRKNRHQLREQRIENRRPVMEFDPRLLSAELHDSTPALPVRECEPDINRFADWHEEASLADNVTFEGREGVQGVDYQVEEPLAEWEHELLYPGVPYKQHGGYGVVVVHDSFDPDHTRECGDCCHEMVAREGLYPETLGEGSFPWGDPQHDLDDNVVVEEVWPPAVTFEQVCEEMAFGFSVVTPYVPAHMRMRSW